MPQVCTLSNDQQRATNVAAKWHLHKSQTKLPYFLLNVSSQKNVLNKFTVPVASSLFYLVKPDANSYISVPIVRNGNRLCSLLYFVQCFLNKLIVTSAAC